VVYGDEPTFVRHNLAIRTAAEITSRVGRANIDLVKATGVAPYLAVMAHELLASQLIWNCLTAKEERFADEREVRGIIMNVRAKFGPWRRTHGGRSYVEHELPLKEADSIVEIIVGPKAETGAEDAVRALLKAEGYPEGTGLCGEILLARSASLQITGKMQAAIGCDLRSANSAHCK
jgi:hypothetical protein